MKIILRSDSVTIEGYVNAVERNSKPLNERGVLFIEKIGAGAFGRAIKRAKDIRILLNHRADRDLGGIKDGNLELEEDNIGLKAKATITDPEVIEQARRGDLVGWSFGFMDKDVEQLTDSETGLPLRKVKDLILEEVSILNRLHTPAYNGTLVSVREVDGEIERVNISDSYEDEIETTDETTLSEEVVEEVTQELEERSAEAEETTEETAPEETVSETKEISSDYFAEYKNMIAEMRS